MHADIYTKYLERQYPVRIYPDPMLRRTALPVEEVTKSVRRFLRGMARMMYYREGIGMAATQIGSRRRLIVADIGEGLLSLINPEILDRRGESSMLEGCLSLPDIGVHVTRSESIVVRGLDAKGREITQDVNGLMARVIQHEIDHLNGVLIIDHGPPEQIAKSEKLSQNPKHAEHNN
jgi:peptide deformylase